VAGKPKTLFRVATQAEDGGSARQSCVVPAMSNPSRLSTFVSPMVAPTVGAKRRALPGIGGPLRNRPPDITLAVLFLSVHVGSIAGKYCR